MTIAVSSCIDQYSNMWSCDPVVGDSPAAVEQGKHRRTGSPYKLTLGTLMVVWLTDNFHNQQADRSSTPWMSNHDLHEEQMPALRKIFEFALSSLSFEYPQGSSTLFSFPNDLGYLTSDEGDVLLLGDTCWARLCQALHASVVDLVEQRFNDKLFGFSHVDIYVCWFMPQW